MRIGIDLERCLYGFPEFFTAFIDAMHAQGHTLLITGNHFPDKRDEDMQAIADCGVDPAKLDFSLMPENRDNFDGPSHKAHMANQCDIVFDDFAKLNQMTGTPVFVVPANKAVDR